ncbi:unnamed protein product [Prorocentrum cordatum]|uniref:Uncharacterized protein n=1 Tax=Prorocentrum cordatum TaxID=2364126 RepID=A0ABN9U777_9DINO|nr:unnamed protein product [Polarella glacialis]
MTAARRIHFRGPWQAVDMDMFRLPGAKRVHLHRPLGHQDVAPQAVDLDEPPPRILATDPAPPGRSTLPRLAAPCRLGCDGPPRRRAASRQTLCGRRRSRGLSRICRGAAASGALGTAASVSQHVSVFCGVSAPVFQAGWKARGVTGLPSTRTLGPQCAQ